MCKPRGEGGAGGKVAGMSRSSCFIQYSDFETQPPFNLSPPWLPAVVALCQSSPWPVDWALLTPPLVLPARPGAHQTGPPLVEPWGLRLFELGILVRGKLLIGWVCVCVDVWVDMWWGGYGGSNRVSMERQKLEHYRTAVNVCTSDNYCKKPIVCKHPITCTRVRTHTHMHTRTHTHTHTHTCTHTHTHPSHLVTICHPGLQLADITHWNWLWLNGVWRRKAPHTTTSALQPHQRAPWG